MPVAAFLAAITCMAVVGFLWLEHELGWQHFRPEPFVLLMVVSSIAIEVSLGVAIVRLVRRRSRWSDLGWLALALAPVGLWTAVGVNGFQNWSRRNVPHDLLMDLARRSGASLMEGEAAWRYRQTATPRCRMFSREGNNHAADAERMDAYLKDLEQFTGHRLREPIHWVRGPLLGLGGLSLYGLALGSTPEEPERDTLDFVDRHEAAHAFMAQALPPLAEPPTILSEGWAEALAVGEILPHPNWGEREKALARDRQEAVAGDVRQSGGRSLATLFGPEWYHQDSGPIYSYGCLLASYLVRQYGPERYLALCARIRPDRVDQVFRDLYGVTLRELEPLIVREVTEGEHVQEPEEPRTKAPSDGS